MPHKGARGLVVITVATVSPILPLLSAAKVVNLDIASHWFQVFNGLVVVIDARFDY